MAFSSQFALSVELSRLVPIPSMASIASSALLDLVRDFRSSGSDFITEIDLAEVFGRCYIAPELAGGFKTLIQRSTRAKLTGIVELVLEAGAGPSVQYGLKNEELFRMIVQVSLLAYTHDLPTLTTSLAKSLEVRNADRPRNVPRYDALLSTLNAIREQTIAYTWKELFEAYELNLEGFGEEDPLQLSWNPFLRRPLAHNVLGALLDTLVAVQRLPDSHSLEIRTNSGLVTLIIWIHNVLGLTVDITVNGHTRQFGSGVSSISIVSTLVASGDCDVILYDESKQQIFSLSRDEFDDPILEPAARHTLKGFGHAYLRDKSSISEASDRPLVLLALREAMKNAEKVPRRVHTLPPASKFLEVAQLLFPDFDIKPQDVVEFDAASITNFNATIRRELGILVQALAQVYDLKSAATAQLSLLAFSRAKHNANVQGSGALNKSEAQALTPKEAFQALAILLTGDINVPIEEAAVVSHSGWSLCMSSVFSTDPGELHTKINLMMGVPSRDKERRHLILDAASGVHSATRGLKIKETFYDVCASPGESTSLLSQFPPPRRKLMIATTDRAFQIYFTYFIEDPPDKSIMFRLGFRYMQELYWSSSSLPLVECDHKFSAASKITVPPNTWAFRGFYEVMATNDSNNCQGSIDPWALTGAFWYKRPMFARYGGDNLKSDPKMLASLPEFCPGRFIHLSMTADNVGLRWLLLLHGAQATEDPLRLPRWSASLNSRQKDPCRFNALFLRRGLCCVACATDFIRGMELADHAHVLLIT